MVKTACGSKGCAIIEMSKPYEPDFGKYVLFDTIQKR